jgi:3-deoxy-D-manno-octulosonic-acid transferase
MVRTQAARVDLNTLERLYALLSPLAFGAAQIVEFLRGASAPELRSRCGWVTPAEGPIIWFHGASAGEMAAASGLAALLRDRGYNFRAVYTAANRSGVEYVSQADPRAASASLAPWDTARSVGRALARWKPLALCLMETELWPRLIFEAYRRDIPVFSLSGRIYPRDFKRYKAIKPFITPTLRRLKKVLTQDETERTRFIELGVPADLCINAGNLKYLTPGVQVANAAPLASEIGLRPDDRVIVIGSAHHGEIQGLFRMLDRLQTERLRVIIAPRHKSSTDSIVKESRARRWSVSRRSDGYVAANWRILALDTMGELKRFYSLASCAVVGGGFGGFGGHNPFEPVIAGSPVLFGPHFDNFGAEARALATMTPEAQGRNAEQLTKPLSNWIGDDALRARILSLQRSALPDSAIIATCYVEILAPWLSDAAHGL